MAKPRKCFETRPRVVHPDPIKVMANLSTGASGRDFVQAIFDDDVARAKQMIQSDPKLLQTYVTFDPRMDAAPEGQYGDALSIAVSSCNIDMIKMLLELGMPADGIQIGQALTTALLADTPEMAELLLMAGASPDPQKKGGINALHDITPFEAKGGVMTLLRHGLDVKWVDNFGNDHLDLALSMEEYVIAELLVEGGANLWRIMGAGNLPAYALNKPPIMELSAVQSAARDRLIATAKKSNLSWPAPDPVTVRNMVLANKWPTTDQMKNGMEISPEAKADIFKRFDGAPKNTATQ